MTSSAETVEQYLAELPEDRRAALQAVRATVLAHKPLEVEEGIQYGAIGYYVPHSVYPPGYHCDPRQPLPYVGVASQKNHMAVYLFCLYVDPEVVEDFKAAYAKAGKKLDMGASCVRFRKLADLDLEAVAAALRAMPLDRFIANYEAQRPQPKKKAAKT